MITEADIKIGTTFTIYGDKTIYTIYDITNEKINIKWGGNHKLEYEKEAFLYNMNSDIWQAKIINLLEEERVLPKKENKISNIGKWLSNAGQYSKGPEGETGGVSGLKFL